MAYMDEQRRVIIMALDAVDNKVATIQRLWPTASGDINAARADAVQEAVAYYEEDCAPKAGHDAMRQAADDAIEYITTPERITPIVDTHFDHAKV